MTVYYNDNDRYCAAVLRARVSDGSLSAGLVDERDIAEVSADDLRSYRQWHLFAGIGGFPLAQAMVGWPDDWDLFTGGFPCQDLSQAGKRAGIEGAKSGLWTEMARLIGDLRPRNVIVENVPGLLSAGMDRVCGDLAALRYDCEWHCIPASSVGALHVRDRIWIVARPRGLEPGTGRAALGDVADAQGGGRGEGHPDSAGRDRRRSQADNGERSADIRSLVADTPGARYAEWQPGTGGQVREAPRGPEPERRSGKVADPDDTREQQPEGSDEGLGRRSGNGGQEASADPGTEGLSLSEQQELFGAGRGQQWRTTSKSRWWSVEPAVGRMAHGVPNRVDRIRSLGNAIVPQVAARLLKALMEMNGHG